MREATQMTPYPGDEDSFNPRDILLKYKHYWPWILGSIVLCLGLGLLYLKFATVSYESVAKIKILDDSNKLDVSEDAMALLGKAPKVNLENEIEILKSYRLLSQVVAELDLNVRYYQKKKIKAAEVWDPPFRVNPHVFENSRDSIATYAVQIGDSGFIVQDAHESTYMGNPRPPARSLGELPFDLELSKDLMSQDYQNKEFEVVITPVKEAALQLSKELGVQPTNENSEILSLVLRGESIERNEAILNTLIEKFNQDGILDRQLVSKRTLDFMDERFFFLSKELDSIEIHKKDFKQSNDLSHIVADAEVILMRKSETQDEVFRLQTQVSLCKMLKETMGEGEVFQLLPVRVGLEEGSINTLINDYNELVLSREKLLESAGADNPLLMVLSKQLQSAKSNIMGSLAVYQKQLELSLGQLNLEKDHSDRMFSKLPEKERVLRAIERQQSIKENLFLLLLQKREEAAINLAITEPSIKVVDYGLTSTIPVSPKKRNVMALSGLVGLLLPIMVLYTKLLMDTKINDRSDLEKANPEIPVLGDIPFIEKEKRSTALNDRSPLAESFRILASNVNYLVPKKNDGTGHIVYVTSTVQGEGKTLVALNLSLAYASMKKKVLLLGGDLRNPQLHHYFDINMDVTGLSDYLHDPGMDWRECIREMVPKDSTHRVCFSGYIPPNAPGLLSGQGFEKFLAHTKNEFDYIIVDTAPILLVTDTLLISKYADATIYITRAGFTDKRLLAFSKDLNRTRKLHNMAYLVNNAGTNKAYGYNYGYGYGYGEQGASKPWYKRLGKNVVLAK